MDKPDFRKGDKVLMRKCPRYPSLETHNAKVTDDPYYAFDKWVVPVKYYCSFDDRTALLRCEDIALIKKGFKMKQLKISKTAIVTGVVLAVSLLAGLWFAGNYNSLVSARNKVDNSWAKVETQYQRRFDLIGNLVESVKGSQIQEQKVFGQIADARKQYQNATTPEEKAAAATNIETNMAVVPRLQEAYPELKSNQNIQSLMKELAGTEGQIATVRDVYNDTANNYNTNIESFPKNIFANMFGHQKRSLFKAEASASKAPAVKFGE